MTNQYHNGDISAFVDRERGEYAIGNASLELRWRQQSDGTLTLERLCPPTDENWAMPTAAGFGMAAQCQDGVPLRLDSARLRWEPEGVLALCLTGNIGDCLAGAFRAELTYRAYPGTTVLTVQASLENVGEQTVSIEGPASLWLAVQPPPGARLVNLRGGAYSDHLPPRGYTLEQVDVNGPGARRRRVWSAGEDGRSSSAYVPWFILQGNSGGLFGALEWSGRWRLETQSDGAGLILAFGLSDFQHQLEPGARLTAPPAILGAFRGDLDDAGAQLHAWEERYLCPPVPSDWPWVQYNHWYAYHGDIDHSRLLTEADLAADVGCEVFVIDDGWFRGRRADSYVQGWGDWVEDRTKFPEGLSAFAEAVHQRGMRFGLWVEPERADLNGDLANVHPEWLAWRDGAVITRRWGNDVAAHLCLGVPAVQEWMAETVIRVVQEYGVDWLKWDYNVGYGLGCNRVDHGHQMGDGHYAHTLGLYRVLTEIRRACPNLVVENCASGGNRADLGLLRYTHTQWLSDYTHRAASCRHHVQGAWYALPPSFLNTWVLDGCDLVELRSRMGGAFGISSHLGKWTDRERQALGTAIAEYKRLRPIVRTKRYIPDVPGYHGWDIWQFHDPEGDRGAILAFRESQGIPSVRIQLRGLRPDRRYQLINGENGEIQEESGDYWLNTGHDVSLPRPHSSLLLWIEPATG